MHAPPPQEIPQPPQLFGSVALFDSQPFVALPSQLLKPALQEIPQTPALQALEEFARAGHTVPQVPQLLRSVALADSQPLATLPSQSL